MSNKLWCNMEDNKNTTFFTCYQYIKHRVFTPISAFFVPQRFDGN